MNHSTGIYANVVDLSYLTDIAPNFPQTKERVVGWPMRPYTNGKDLLITFPRSHSTITHEIFTNYYLGNTWDGLLKHCKTRIMLIRNQFDRILSAFYNDPEQCLDFFPPDEDFSSLTFREFVIYALPSTISWMVENFEYSIDSKAYHIAPYWLCLFGGNFKYLVENHDNLLNEGFVYVTTDRYKELLQVLKLRGFNINPSQADVRSSLIKKIVYSKSNMFEPYNIPWKDLKELNSKPTVSEMYNSEMEECMRDLYTRDMYVFDKSILELKRETK